VGTCRQCGIHGLSLATITGRWLRETPFVQVSTTWALTCLETVRRRPCMTREIETRLSDSRVGNNSVVDQRRPVFSPLRNCVGSCHVWPCWASRSKPCVPVEQCAGEYSVFKRHSVPKVFNNRVQDRPFIRSFNSDNYPSLFICYARRQHKHRYEIQWKNCRFKNMLKGKESKHQKRIDIMCLLFICFGSARSKFQFHQFPIGDKLFQALDITDNSLSAKRGLTVHWGSRRGISGICPVFRCALRFDWTPLTLNVMSCHVPSFERNTDDTTGCYLLVWLFLLSFIHPSVQFISDASL